MSIPKLIVAIILNIFVMPGAGQMFVKEKRRGYIFVGLAVAVLFIGTYCFTVFFKEEMAGLKFSQDIMGMAQAMQANLWVKHDLALRGLMFAFGATYIGSIFDMILIYLDRKES